MSSGDHPHIRPVETPPVGGVESPAAERTVPASTPALPPRGRAWLVPALCVGLLVCAGGWLWQARGAAQLEAQLASSQAALARSEARVGSLEGYLGSVRDRFATLQSTLESELEALGGLLATEPGSAPPADR